MITIKEFPGKEFATKEDALRELVINKSKILATKKAETKHADAVSYRTPSEAVQKSAAAGDPSVITVKAVSNACNFFDSHCDVSLPGSWNRTAKNTRNGLHLQEHQMNYDKVISEDVAFSVENKSWGDLGFPYEGETECLVMTSKVSKDDNPAMFKRYLNGKVKNHSAGLRYVNIGLAVNSDAEYAKEEKAVWDKYYPQIANKEDVDEVGYFFPVFEQKIIENSAVLRGSNPATPTISVEPADSTSTKTDDPADATHSESEPKKCVNLNFY